MSGYISWVDKKCECVPRKSDVSIRLWDLVDIPSGQLRHASQMSLSGPCAHVCVDDDGDDKSNEKTVLRTTLRYLAPAPMDALSCLRFDNLPSRSAAVSRYLVLIRPLDTRKIRDLPKDSAVGEETPGGSDGRESGIL